MFAIVRTTYQTIRMLGCGDKIILSTKIEQIRMDPSRYIAAFEGPEI